MSADTTPKRAARYLPDDWSLPLINDMNLPFFTAGELRVQRCDQCSRVQHPPMDVCRFCQSLLLHSEPAAGKGTIASYTIVHHAADSRLIPVVPYNVAVIALDDHPEVMIVGNVTNAEPAQLAVGARVRCTFVEVEDTTGGITLMLPQWQLAS